MTRAASLTISARNGYTGKIFSAVTERSLATLSFVEVVGEAGPPVTEQLVSSLRHRHHRERQGEFRDRGQASQVASPNAADGDGEAIP